MKRKALLLAGGALLLVLPRPAAAGGPPWLCLPVDGVTADNARECGELLGAKLESKLWQHDGPYREVRVNRHRDQWYASMSISQDVRLSEVEAALKGSPFSVPRDKLRLFGHVVLEIDAGATPAKALLAAVDALDTATIAASEEHDGRLLVTVEMPYPKAPHRDAVGWDEFETSYVAEPRTRETISATAGTLPGFEEFQGLAAKSDATLTDIRWSIDYWCRPLGAVTAPDRDGAGQVAQAVAGK